MAALARTPLRSARKPAGEDLTRREAFGHKEGPNGILVVYEAVGGLVWADNKAELTPEQFAAMPRFQREEVMRRVPTARRASVDGHLRGRRYDRGRIPFPASARTGERPPAFRDLTNLLNLARATSTGRQPDGKAWDHVWSFVARVGYGNIATQGVPDSHRRNAVLFARYCSDNARALGLRKLPIDNPYAAPAGAIVVMAPGSPGLNHRHADVAVADGRGRFFNGGEANWGGREAYEPGNTYVLGVFIPG